MDTLRDEHVIVDHASIAFGDGMEKKVGMQMAMNAITYDVTFRDFQFLQGYMARRVLVRNKQKYGAVIPRWLSPAAIERSDAAPTD
jgi:hypothetical protein